MAQIISSQELDRLRSQQPDLMVVDVRLPEDFEGSHLPGAVNQCVFEVVFLEDLIKKSSDKSNNICVYGAASDSHESCVAAEKLEHAGFANVIELRDGLQGWRNAGFPVEEKASPSAASTISDGRYPIDLAESKVVWIGRNLINKHWGHVAIANGEVEFRQGRPVMGEATLDLRRISCADLAQSELHDVLIHHLESDDFFDVARFPEAKFSFQSSEICSDNPGCRNLKLRGELTLRGVTRPLMIEAAAGFTPEGKAALQSVFTIDRTEWGVIYGSGKFFRGLAGHLVNDEIELQLRVVTTGK